MLKRSLRPRQRPDSLSTEHISTSGPPAGAGPAALATRQVEIDPFRPILLGTFGAPYRRGALVRLPDGRTQRIAVGDRVAGDEVVAIADTSIVVDHKGLARRIGLPEDA